MRHNIDPEDLDELRKERKIAQSFSGGNSRLELEPGESALIRVLPAEFGERRSWYARISQHWVSKRPYICPRMTAPAMGGDPDKECPICDRINRMLESRTESIRSAADRAREGPRWLVLAIVWEITDVKGKVKNTTEDERKVAKKIWLNREGFLELSQLFQDRLAKDCDMLDPETGFDIILSRSKNKRQSVKREDPAPIFKGMSREQLLATADKMWRAVDTRRDIMMPTLEKLDEAALKLSDRSDMDENSDEDDRRSSRDTENRRGGSSRRDEAPSGQRGGEDRRGGSDPRGDRPEGSDRRSDSQDRREPLPETDRRSDREAPHAAPADSRRSEAASRRADPAPAEENRRERVAEPAPSEDRRASAPQEERRRSSRADDDAGLDRSQTRDTESRVERRSDPDPKDDPSRAATRDRRLDPPPSGRNRPPPEDDGHEGDPSPERRDPAPPADDIPFEDRDDRPPPPLPEAKPSSKPSNLSDAARGELRSAARK